MSPTQTKALRRRNLVTALAVAAIATAIAVSMFAYRFANHLSPMPETGGYSSPYLPTH